MINMMQENYSLPFSLTPILVAIVAVLLTFSYWKLLFVRRRYPPGPFPLPFLHNGLMMFKENGARYMFEANTPVYGNLVTMWIFGKPRVWISGYDVIYEAFVKNADALSEREKLLNLDEVLGDGIVNSKRWKELRKHAMIVFREHGMGKMSIENSIREETEFMLKELSHLHTNEPVSLRILTKQAVGNVTNRIVFGNRFEYDDESHFAMLEVESVFMKTVKMRVLPFLKLVPGDPIGYYQSVRQLKSTMEFFKLVLKQHRQSLDVNEPRDYIDSYLIEQMKGHNDEVFTDDNLLATILQLYVAGSDTTTSSLSWAFLYMLIYPDIQQKVYDEITLVIGSRPMSLSDRDSLHYTQAVLTEVMRIQPVAGLSLNHLTTRDVHIQGQVIPQGTPVIANLYSLAYDESLYPSPHQFKPERFLDQNGHYQKPVGPCNLPFSIGRRSCIGESLAKAEFIMFFVSILQHFRLESSHPKSLNTRGYITLTHNPLPYKVRLIHREVTFG